LALACMFATEHTSLPEVPGEFGSDGEVEEEEDEPEFEELAPVPEELDEELEPEGPDVEVEVEPEFVLFPEVEPLVVPVDPGLFTLRLLLAAVTAELSLKPESQDARKRKESAMALYFIAESPGDQKQASLSII